MARAGPRALFLLENNQYELMLFEYNNGNPIYYVSIISFV